jgi:hypothetical protein
MSPDAETGMFDLYQHRAADAHVDLAASGGGADGIPVQVSVFADLEALTTTHQGTAYLDNTAPIPNTTAQRLGCDGTIQTIIKDGSQIIGIGRRTRKVPGWLRRLVIERDNGICQHPGCRHTSWLQAHHIVPWALGGPTNLDNLILICGTHHRFVQRTRLAHHRTTRQTSVPPTRLDPTPQDQATDHRPARPTHPNLGAAAPNSDHRQPNRPPIEPPPSSGPWPLARFSSGRSFGRSFRIFEGG